MSPRLARSRGDLSRFHVDLKPARTTISQACLGILLQLDEDDDHRSANRYPLVEHAAQHWVGHAQFEDVSSYIRYGIYNLFDSSKPPPGATEHAPARFHAPAASPRSP